jgi:cytochrome c-type biogenesis protein CcmE
MKPRHRRIGLIVAGLAGLSVAAWLAFSAFEQNLVFFFTPTQVAANEAPRQRAFRVGGMVEVGSVKRQPDGVTVQFVVTDTAKTMLVAYKGVLPDLFREGKGVVAQGRLENGLFVASEVLAKHDENYMPPAAAHALKKGQEINEKATRSVVNSPQGK